MGWYPNNTPAYDYVYYPKATYCITYIARLPAGTRLEWAVEINKLRGDWKTQSGSFQIRGWSEGFFGGDGMDYEDIGVRSTDGWQTYTGEITIDERHNDLWLAFQQTGLITPLNTKISTFVIFKSERDEHPRYF